MERRSKKIHDPKGKGIRIEEPHQVEEEEEEEEAPSHPTSIIFKFIDDTHQQLFEHLQQKSIKTGAEIRIHEIGQFSLLPLFQFQKWDSILHISEKTHKILTYMFYANIVRVVEDNTRFTTMVQGKSFIVSPKLIGRVLGIPYKGLDIYGETLSSFTSYPDGQSKETASKLLHGTSRLFNDSKANTLLPRAHVLSSILGFTIFPKSGGRDRVTTSHKLLTYCVLSKIKVNLPLLIVKNMLALPSSTGNLYYGNLITKILKFTGIDPNVDYSLVKQDTYFGDFNIKLMRLADKPISEDEEDSSDSEIPAPQSSSQPPPITHDFQNLLLSRLDSIESKVDYGFAYTQYHINHFYTSSGYPQPPPFVYPPPPPPPPSPPPQAEDIPAEDED